MGRLRLLRSQCRTRLYLGFHSNTIQLDIYIAWSKDFLVSINYAVGKDFLAEEDSLGIHKLPISNPDFSLLKVGPTNQANIMNSCQWHP